MNNHDFINRLTKTGWKAGYGYIINGLLFTIVSWWMVETNFYLVKKNACVEINNSAQVVAINNKTMKDAYNDSINIAYSLNQNPVKESKDNYLSLWAAVLAVIFVVFSIFGVLKLELTKEDIERKYEDLKKEGEDIKNLHKNLNEIIRTSEQHSSLIQKISIHFIASSSDNEESRIRRLEEITCILNCLKDVGSNIDNYELLLSIFSMTIKGRDEESKRMELIINKLLANENGDEKFAVDKTLLLGRAYYRLYTSTDQDNKYKHDSLKMSISAYCSILQTYNLDIIDDDLFKKMELSKISFSNKTQTSSEHKNEINDILYECSRALYDYALNYCDEDFKQIVLKKASNILNKLTK